MANIDSCGGSSLVALLSFADELMHWFLWTWNSRTFYLVLIGRTKSLMTGRLGNYVNTLSETLFEYPRYFCVVS